MPRARRQSSEFVANATMAARVSASVRAFVPSSRTRASRSLSHLSRQPLARLLFSDEREERGHFGAVVEACQCEAQGHEERLAFGPGLFLHGVGEGGPC